MRARSSEGTEQATCAAPPARDLTDQDMCSVHGGAVGSNKQTRLRRQEGFPNPTGILRRASCTSAEGLSNARPSKLLATSSSAASSTGFAGTSAVLPLVYECFEAMKLVNASLHDYRQKSRHEKRTFSLHSQCGIPRPVLMRALSKRLRKTRSHT